MTFLWMLTAWVDFITHGSHFTVVTHLLDRAEYLWIASLTLMITSLGSWRPSSCPCQRRQLATGKIATTKSSVSTLFSDRCQGSWISAASTWKTTVHIVKVDKTLNKSGTNIIRMCLRMNIFTQKASLSSLGLQTVGIFRVGSSKKRVRQVRFQVVSDYTPLHS